MLHRLALRLAAIEALCPFASIGSGPYPTIAGDRVFDSRQDAIDTLAEDEARPILVVYTECQEDHRFGSGSRDLDESIIDLTIEAVMAVKGSVDIEQADGSVETIGTVGAPFTDPRHEAYLDLLEAGVRYALSRQNITPEGLVFNGLAMELRSGRSDPQRSPDKTVKLALRTIELKIKTKTTEWPAAATPAASGLDALPQPLRDVAQGLPAGSPGRMLCEELAGFMPNTPALPATLDGITIYAGMGRLPDPGTPATTADVIATEPPRADL